MIMRMHRIPILLCLVLGTAGGLAGERIIDFSQYAVGRQPTGFVSLVSGEGPAGDWRIRTDEIPGAEPVITGKSPVMRQQAVLAQLSQDPTDERYPLLVLDDEVFGDFTLSTRFKTVAGVKEQMAGLAFRIQNASNYYVVRASTLGQNVRFYKFVNGLRTPPVGPSLVIATGVWHELTVECRGNKIRCLLDGIERILGADPQNSFTNGKVGFWTKSDSVTHFANTRIAFTARESIAPSLVRDAQQRYPRVLALRISALTRDSQAPRIIASSRASEVGQPPDAEEIDVLRREIIHTDKGRGEIRVTLPLHDRNGDPVAALRVTLKPFLGQTIANVIGRARPIAEYMEERIRDQGDLVP